MLLVEAEASDDEDDDEGEGDEDDESESDQVASKNDEGGGDEDDDESESDQAVSEDDGSGKNDTYRDELHYIVEDFRSQLTIQPRSEVKQVSGPRLEDYTKDNGEDPFKNVPDCYEIVV